MTPENPRSFIPVSMYCISIPRAKCRKNSVTGTELKMDKMSQSHWAVPLSSSQKIYNIFFVLILPKSYPNPFFVNFTNLNRSTGKYFRFNKKWPNPIFLLSTKLCRVPVVFRRRKCHKILRKNVKYHDLSDLPHAPLTPSTHKYLNMQWASHQELSNTPQRIYRIERILKNKNP